MTLEELCAKCSFYSDAFSSFNFTASYTTHTYEVKSPFKYTTQELIRYRWYITSK